MRITKTVVQSLFFGSCFITFWYSKVTNDSLKIDFLEADILIIFGILFYAIASYLLYIDNKK